MPYIENNEGLRTYFEHHRGEKMPVVFIHGWGMSGEYWNSAAEALIASGHGAIIIDHRGCGRSDRDFTDLSIDAIADDVCAIVQGSGLDRVALNGWSLGGAVAVAAADLLGDKIAGLILTCAATPRYVQGEDFPYGGKPEDVSAIAAAITADRAGFFRTLALGAAAEGANPALIDWFERGFLASGPRASETLMDLVTLDQRKMLAGFSFPILSIGGGKDTIADPSIAGYAAKCAAHGTLLTFKDSGHSPHLEEPVRYHEAILSFLGELK
jgi:non-heme chloroperoxidase